MGSPVAAVFCLLPTPRQKDASSPAGPDVQSGWRLCHATHRPCGALGPGGGPQGLEGRWSVCVGFWPRREHSGMVEGARAFQTGRTAGGSSSVGPLPAVAPELLLELGLRACLQPSGRPACVLTRLALLRFAPKRKCVRDLGSRRRQEPDFRPVFSLGLQLCPSHVDLGPEPLGACGHEKPVLLWEECI